MLSKPQYRLLADVVLLLHFTVVLFVVGGLVLVIIGNVRSWRWVNLSLFRVAHIGAMGVVVVEAWLGLNCPLTTIEVWLRAKAGGATYSGSFIEHWLQRLLFYEAPSWAFVLGYSIFGFLVLAAWWCFPPRFKNRCNEGGA
jgi:hypothetical protein